MATDTLRTRRPPGNPGPPLLGETLAFTKDPFGFVQDRRARYGRVFRTNLLGRNTVVLIGPEPLEAFYDSDNVVRAGASPANVQTLFGGTTVINALDGAAHASRSRTVSAALSREAIESYMPAMTRYVDAAFARWTAAGEIGWNDELKRLTIETLGAVFASVEPGPELVELVRRSELIAAAFTALPVPFPRTPYMKGVRAKDEALAYYRELARAHRAQPKDDGLSRMLAARADDGTALDDVQAAGELHHLFLAGYIVFAQFVGTIVHLTENAGVRERLEAELATLPASPSTADLAAQTYLMQVVNEVRRVTPIVPAVFGKARRAFVVDGFEIPSGWTVAASVWGNDREPSSYSDPARFDPDRFGVRAEHRSHPYAYTPQGAGPPDGHRCPGFDLSSVFMAIFTAQLVRGYTWELPAQDLAPNWAVIPPVPRDGLRAVVRRRA